MKNELGLTRQELRIIVFYAGIDNVIYDIERTIEKSAKKRKGDWEQVNKIRQDELKLMKSLSEKIYKFLLFDEE